MISPQFLEFVSSVKEKLGKNTYGSEAAVSMMIVLPVLKHLGWPADDPSYVCPEYRLEGRKVDYGLKISRGKEEGLRCIIEVKAVGNIIDADRQLFEYAFLAGVPLAVLTDGRLWRFYLPLVAGQYKERLVRTLDIEEHSTEEVIRVLTRYISFGNTQSGQAKKNAESDLNERITKIEAKENISIAWQSLLDGTSDKLVNLLIEETSLISSAPERSDVEEFLKSLENAELEPKPKTTRRKKPEPKKPESRKRTKVAPPEPEKLPKTSGRKTTFFLLGEEYTEAGYSVNAYVKIMKILAARDKDFTIRLAPLTAGKKNKWLSRNREDMVVYKMAREVSPGWWLDTNVSNKDKIRRLRVACEAAGIPFGKPNGLKITF